jgi:hypothetical protein
MVEAKYGEVFSSLRPGKDGKPNPYNHYFIVRRFFLVVSLYYLQDHLVLQLTALNVGSLFAYSFTLSH